MKILLLVIATYLAAILETSLGDLLLVGHVGPDLMALVAVLWVLWVPGRRAFLGAGLVGLARDLLAPGRLGLAMGLFLVAGYLLMRLKTRLPLRRPGWQAAAVLVSVTLLATAAAIGCRLLGEATIPWAAIPGRVVGVGVYTAGLSLPMVMIFSWTRRPSPLAEPWG